MLVGDRGYAIESLHLRLRKHPVGHCAAAWQGLLITHSMAEGPAASSCLLAPVAQSLQFRKSYFAQLKASVFEAPPIFKLMQTSFAIMLTSNSAFLSVRDPCLCPFAKLLTDNQVPFSRLSFLPSPSTKLLLKSIQHDFKHSVQDAERWKSSSRGKLTFKYGVRYLT